jgi:hypothetical protein
MTMRGLLALATLLPLLVLAGRPARAGEIPPEARKVAEAYGLARFRDVRELRFTFNARIGERTISRAWRWRPHEHKVVLEEAGGPFVIDDRFPAADANEKMRSVHSQFINDQYWLIFPLHLVWDEGTRITTDIAAPPDSGDTARRVTVRYSGDGGYTPGDMYRLYLDRAHRVTVWTYHKSGADTPSRTTKWLDHRRLGPLVVSLDRPGLDGTFRVRFTDVSVTDKRGRVFRASSED